MWSKTCVTQDTGEINEGNQSGGTHTHTHTKSLQYMVDYRETAAIFMISKVKVIALLVSL